MEPWKYQDHKKYYKKANGPPFACNFLYHIEVSRSKLIYSVIIDQFLYDGDITVIWVEELSVSLIYSVYLSSYNITHFNLFTTDTVPRLVFLLIQKDFIWEKQTFPVEPVIAETALCHEITFVLFNIFFKIYILGSTINI